jgi:hypothetical protein
MFGHISNKNLTNEVYQYFLKVLNKLNLETALDAAFWYIAEYSFYKRELEF